MGRLEGFQTARAMQKQSDEQHISALLNAVLELSRKVQWLEAEQHHGLTKIEEARTAAAQRADEVSGGKKVSVCRVFPAPVCRAPTRNLVTYSGSEGASIAEGGMEQGTLRDGIRGVSVPTRGAADQGTS